MVGIEVLQFHSSIEIERNTKDGSEYESIQDFEAPSQHNDDDDTTTKTTQTHHWQD